MVECGQLVKAWKVVCKGHARTVFGRVVGELAEVETDAAGQRREYAGRLREAVESVSAGPELAEELTAVPEALWQVMEKRKRMR